MASRVFLHVGLPKTGTTYLQSILWRNRDELRRQGVLLPGFGPRQHLWASGAVREDPNLDRRGPRARHAWTELVGEIAAWDGAALVSHEFFAGASEKQVRHVLIDLEPAEVHVVVTARDTLSLVTARWQEFVKNGSTAPIDEYPATEDTNPHDEWDWGTMDVGDVLGRWGADLPPERVHLLTLPKPDEPRDTLWLRFADLVGFDPAHCDASTSEQNESLGVVEVELLRRVNGDLDGFRSAFNRGVWIRGYLAQGKLVPRQGEKFWPSAERVAQLRARGDRAVARIEAAGYDVVGDPEDLRTPLTLPHRRHPSSVTDGELLDAASKTIAEMLTDVRRLTNQKRRAQESAGSRARLTAHGPRPLVRRAVSRAGGLVRRLWRRS